MPETGFSKWSPGGNTTIFLPMSAFEPGQAGRLAALMQGPEMLSAEQLGFVDEAAHRLRMAGGEFCLNASRAFGALLAMRGLLAPAPGGRHECPGPLMCGKARVSGLAGWVDLRVSGVAPRFYASAAFSLADGLISRPQPDIWLARLPGICHVLLPLPAHGLPASPAASAAAIRRSLSLEREDACGVVWWEQGADLRIWPLVHVRDAGTEIMEMSCGSGSLALALALAGAAGGSFSIRQPGGTTLDVSLGRGEAGELLASVGGPVDLVAEGRVWLPEAPSCAPEQK